jgi:hypothetical protein
MGGVLIAIAAVFFSRAPIRSTFIAALGIGTLVGFLGACLRLAGTTDLAARYLAATPADRASQLQSYLDLQQQINISFSAGGLLIGLALVLAASMEPLGLLSAALLIISFSRLAGTFRRQVPAGGVANAPAS